MPNLKAKDFNQEEESKLRSFKQKQLRELDTLQDDIYRKKYSYRKESRFRHEQKA